jgi:hypothetical protein
MNLATRLRKLESRQFDSTGLVPQSEAWFAFWEDKFERSINGEDVDCAGFTLTVIDRMVAAADRANACGLVAR